MRGKLIVFLIMILWMISSCGKEEIESKSMDQLYKENGVPVKIEKLEYKTFAKELSFHSAFSGSEQTSVYASFGGRVEKIHVEVGDYVKKDQLIVSFPMDNPKANYYQAKTAYESSKLALERLKNLKQTGGVSQQNFDNAEAQYNVARANWDVVRKSVKVIAPFGGVITKISVSETENVKKEAELFTVSRLNKLKTKVWVTEKEIFEVKEGLLARALWNNLRLKGRVARVDMAMNIRSQAFGALLKFDNPKNFLLLGITAEVYIETYTNPKAIVIERKNIKNENGETYVFVNENSKAVKRPVVIGEKQGLALEIKEGLNPGDELIVEGLMLIEEDTKLKIIE